MGLPSARRTKRIFLAAILVGVVVGAVISVIGPLPGWPGEVAVAAIVALSGFAVVYVLAALGLFRSE